MAHDEHVKMLSQNVVDWNNWRRLNYKILPNLSGTDLSRATLVGTNLANTKLKDCTIYGIAAWDVQLKGAEQINLTITRRDQPTITVDNLKIAQFIYLLLDNAEIRDVINTLTTKSVLLLGRFTRERKEVLDAIRDELRNNNYLPLLFDFDQPMSRDITETVTTLVFRMARFTCLAPFRRILVQHQNTSPVRIRCHNAFALTSCQQHKKSKRLPPRSHPAICVMRSKGTTAHPTPIKGDIPTNHSEGVLRGTPGMDSRRRRQGCRRHDHFC